MKKVCLAYITYDGVLNTMCGVGALSRTFIDSFLEVREILFKYKIDLSLNLITIALTEGADGFSAETLEKSKDISKKTGGNVYFIINDSEGDNQFGTIKNWRVASISAATKVLELSQDFDETLVYCIDTPFLHVPYFVNRQRVAYKKSNIKFLLVFHSDVLIHHPNNPDRDRLTWEQFSINGAKKSDNVYIAKTSEFLISHLNKNYKIPNSKIIDFITGILPTDDKYKLFSDQKIKEFLLKYDIPLDKKLIFSVARAVEYKGFERLIEVVARLNDAVHLVFVAAPYNDRYCNVEDLKNQISCYGLSCNSVFNIDFELPKYICQWKNTKIVAQLAKHEPFGLVPEDVRMWSRKSGPLILTSDREGFVEQINDGEDGFSVDVSDVGLITNKINSILHLSEKEVETIRSSGYKRVISNYDYRVSMLKSIFALVDLEYPVGIEKELTYDNLF